VSALDVHLHDVLVGRLERLDQARLRFTYTERAVAEGNGSLSLSLPLRAEPFDDVECRPFFGGLLPEGDFLRAVGRAFGVAPTNAFAVLAAIGGECAGAVSLTGAGSPRPAERPPRWLGSHELHQLITSLPSRPLLSGDEEGGLRLSLAGAQDKLPVLFEGGRLGVTRGVPPSTHIIKLPDVRFADMVANEAYGLALAAEAGIEAAAARPRLTSTHAFERSPDDREHLLVRRYDRSDDGGAVRRVHQEDLCQALGFVPEQKYEADGGPGVAGCADLIRRRAAAPALDLLAFLDALLFNFMIGNHDAHAKNYSLILEGPRAPRIAPLYDLLSTVVYEGLSRKMAMKLGGEYRPPYVRGRHLERLAGDLGMGVPAVRDRALAVRDRVIEAVAGGPALLPAEFADREILTRINGVIDDRSKLLADAAAEL